MFNLFMDSKKQQIVSGPYLLDKNHKKDYECQEIDIQKFVTEYKILKEVGQKVMKLIAKNEINAAVTN